MSNRKFWNTVKPFLTSKVFLHNDNISIDFNGNIVENEQKLTERIKEFNSYFIHIAKTTSGNPPMKLENSLGYVNDSLITKGIIEKFKNHPSLKAVKKEFKIEEVKVDQVNKILRILILEKLQDRTKLLRKLSRCRQILSTLIWIT